MSTSLKLLELQQAFSRALFNPTDDGSNLPLKAYSSGAKQQRLDIYRNNMFYSLTRALGELYPVTRQLAGDEFFYTAAREYLQEYPPTHAAMVYLGAQFPGFLQKYEYARTYEWFADMARLELARHESYHAEDMQALALETLDALDPVQLATSTAVFHPSFRLVYSEVPLFNIWSMHQQDILPDEAPGLEDGGETVMLVRPQFEVNVTVVDASTSLFLSSLRQGKTLQEALMTVTDTMPDSKPEHSLATLLISGVFVAFKGESE